MGAFFARVSASVWLLISASAAWAIDDCAFDPEGFDPLPVKSHDDVKVEADEIEFPERKVVLLKGFTQLLRGGHRVHADELVYYKLANKAEARGSVKLETAEGDVVITPVLEYDISSGVAVSGPATFMIANRHHKLVGSGDSSVNAYGTADQVTFEGDNVMLLENAQVTSCLDGRKDITFNADDLTVDLEKGVRTGNRVKIQIAEPEKHKKVREKLVIN